MNYSDATERDLLEEISLAQMGIAREEKRLAEARQALVAFRVKTNGEASKREEEPAESQR